MGMSRWTYNVEDVPDEVLAQIGKAPDELRHIKLSFLTKVRYDTQTGCWLWTRHINKWGYGIFRFKGGGKRAHQVSRHLFTECDIDDHDDEVTRHRCPSGRKHCVNPEHLKSGKQWENILDAILDGDMDRKFSRNEIRAIHTLGDDGTLTQEEIGEVFGTDQAQVGRIVKREQYDWVE